MNVYTMDCRGTGQSTLLDCVGTPTNINKSRPNILIDVSQVPACAQELEKKYGDLSSFSVTSIAMDVATIISDHTNGMNTIVYGGNHDTVYVERLIHLSPPKVTGYVLDGVVTVSGAPRDKTPFESLADSDYGEVGDAFLALCATQSECSKRFVSKSLPATLQDLITKLDKNPKSTCAALVSSLNSWSTEPASYILRRLLANLLADIVMLPLIPIIVYRLHRCDMNDYSVLANFFMAYQAFELTTHLLTDSETITSPRPPLLDYLVNFSERWETPTPSVAEMTSRFTDALISSANAYLTTPIYCAFSKKKSAVCDQLGVGEYDATVLFTRSTNTGTRVL